MGGGPEDVLGFGLMWGSNGGWASRRSLAMREGFAVQRGFGVWKDNEEEFGMLGRNGGATL